MRETTEPGFWALIIKISGQMGWVEHDFGEILYVISVVVGNTYSIYTKMGATIPVLKNEIEDFFFRSVGHRKDLSLLLTS